MGQEVEGIDWVGKEGRDKGKKGGVSKRKDSLFIEGFERKIQLIGIGK